jgi:hypothetical protein
VGPRALILALLVGCAGPQPSIDRVEVGASPLAGHVRVTGRLLNRAGHGTVEVHITLHGAVTLRADHTIDVEDHQTVELAIDVAAPPGAYTADATAEYPN